MYANTGHFALFSYSRHRRSYCRQLLQQDIRPETGGAALNRLDRRHCHQDPSQLVSSRYILSNRPVRELFLPCARSSCKRSFTLCAACLERRKRIRSDVVVTSVQEQPCRSTPYRPLE